MPYQATKAAVMALTFYLAEEVRSDGIAVNAIMPGHTRASWFDATARAFNEMGIAYFMRPATPNTCCPISLFLPRRTARGRPGASTTCRTGTTTTATGTTPRGRTTSSPGHGGDLQRAGGSDPCLRASRRGAPALRRAGRPLRPAWRISAENSWASTDSAQ